MDLEILKKQQLIKRAELRKTIYRESSFIDKIKMILRDFFEKEK